MKLRIRVSVVIPEGEIQPEAKPHELKKEFGPAIQRAIAAGFPDHIHPETVIVTKFNIALDAVGADQPEE